MKEGLPWESTWGHPFAFQKHPLLILRLRWVHFSGFGHFLANSRIGAFLLHYCHCFAFIKGNLGPFNTCLLLHLLILGCLPIKLLVLVVLFNCTIFPFVSSWCCLGGLLVSVFKWHIFKWEFLKCEINPQELYFVLTCMS